MHLVFGDVPNCSVYLDDVVVCFANWKDRVFRLAEVFQRLAEASLTLNLAKCVFGKASVTYVAKQVGHGQVPPVGIKVTAILTYLVPTTRRELQSFLDMTGYYLCFGKNFSAVVAPLTKQCSPVLPLQYCHGCA